MPSPSDRNLMFCFGFGYSARRLAARLTGDEWRVAGTFHADGGGGQQEADGLFPFGRDRPLEGDGLAALRSASHVLISIPPDRQGDIVLARHRTDIADIASRTGLRWLGYLSTTGVYGDAQGQWVDETAALRPTSARSERRVAAERAWLALGEKVGIPVHIFRLAGIYGPGRSALDQVRNGTARRIDKPDHLFGRIHVDDIAGALRRSMEKPRPGAVYNVADDEPASAADVVAHACDLLGREPPPLVPFAEAAREMSEMALSFWRDRRRIDSRLIKRELGLEWLYPDYRAGLEAILKAEAD